MGIPYRSIRAAATALLVTAAVGSGGMGGFSTALASDPGRVMLAGTLIDAAGAPLAGVHLTISEELAPDGGAFEIAAITAADGSFNAEIYAWGTRVAPASLTISTPAGEAIDVATANCSRTWGVALSDDRKVALAEATPTILIADGVDEPAGRGLRHGRGPADGRNRRHGRR